MRVQDSLLADRTRSEVKRTCRENGCYQMLDEDNELERGGIHDICGEKYCGEHIDAHCCVSE